MKKILLILALTIGSYTIAQNIGINPTGANPDPSAILDLSTTDKGFLMPRLTTTQRDAIQNPAVGLQIFNLDSDCVEVFFGTGQWKFIQCGCNTVPNAPSGILGSIDVCLNQTGVSYSVPAQNGVSSYTWSSSDTNDVINGQGTSSIQIDFVGAGVRTLAVVAANSCGFSDTTYLTVNSDNPNSTFSPLVGAINQGVNFLSQTYQNASYIWTFDQGTPPTSTSQNPSVTWINQGTYAVSLTITDSVGCSSTTSDSIVILNCQHNSITFNYTGSIQTWNPPMDACSNLTIEVWGAQGGTNGGLGGYAIGDLTNQNQTFYIYVGGQGTNNGYGGFNGGGNSSGSTYGGSGGGASDVRVGGQTLNERIIVAGGGGGGTSGSTPSPGGDGGGLTGSIGQSGGGFTGGTGGTQSSGGNSGCCYSGSDNGTFGIGGGNGSYHNAGGGGGWYGGGSGAGHAGGGGGSGYIGGVANGSMQTGTQTGNGTITISW